jgi:hypothetical protein
MIGKFMKIRNITTNQIVYVAPEYEQLITVFMTFQQRLSMCDKMIQDGLMKIGKELLSKENII